MGLLSKGDRLLSWEETKKQAQSVRKTGVRQFISAFRRAQERQHGPDPFKWGDELEFCLATLNHDEQKAQLSLLGATLLPEMQRPEREDPEHCQTNWTPEYARYMIEGTPHRPYGDDLSEVLKVEENMKLRRQQLYDALKGTNTFPLTLSVFPRMGCPDFTSPPYKPTPQHSIMKSMWFPDEVVVQPSEHPRFMGVTSSVHERRQHKHAINVPVFQDKNTPMPFIEQLPTSEGVSFDGIALPDHIYMDCIAFGPGCCCLQVTLQAPDFESARYLYDQMCVLGPLFQALTAGSPIYRGYLADVDSRWDIIAAAVDDRTPGERGLEPPEKNELFIPKSRWATAECYLGSVQYNDVYVPNDPQLYQELRDGGLDDLMAKHIAYLFIRDPLILFKSSLDQNPETDTNHYENLLTSNWQSMRFKIPKPEINAGWRVEVRTMDHQLTDAENAAIAVFIMLLSRTVLALRPSLYIPMTRVEDNMREVQKRDALRQGKFYFRHNLFPHLEPHGGPSAHYKECELMDSNTIFNGADDFPGLIPLVRRYVESTRVDGEAAAYINKVLKYVSMKASGELVTTATWIRQFVTSHHDYKQDSCVTDKITYDLISAIQQIAEGKMTHPKVAGEFVTDNRQ